MQTSPPEHGEGIFTYGKAIFYLHPKNTRQHYRLMQLIDIGNPDRLNFRDIYGVGHDPYTTLVDLYSGLSKLSGKKLSVEKKSPNVSLKNEKVILEVQEPIIPYEIRLQNFNTIIAKKTEQHLQSKANQSAKITAQDVTLLFFNTKKHWTTINNIHLKINKNQKHET